EYNRSPIIGTMIEMPSVLTIIDELAAKADFFSIGTNDFIQYMLAVDRTNENVAEYYQPFQPVILRALANIVRRLGQFGKPISVCGETAHDPEFVAFLLGIGVRRLSLDPQYLPAIQQVIAAKSIAAVENFANELVAASSYQEVQMIRTRYKEKN
ncbi:MAG: phosphoenolpyruvate--protein phosphotransferase, partial [Desulfobacteraceae bacterium]|nr:phosphoenolpyruvate--protein phosphotransferase [Desulfobacteraceae bacterium]